MTPAEIQALSAPISEDEPCGPDLETLGDADYMRFVARVESFLPQSFSAFDRASIDFPAELATLKSLLRRSRDLRLMAFLAKLLILNRDLPGFLASFQTMEALLDQQWEPIHPQLLDGDAILRVVAVQMLDDLPDAVMPLQTTPLFETRRFGKVSYRAHLLASGQIQPRTNADGEVEEEPPTASDLRTALTEADLTHLVAARDLHVALRQSYKRIETLAAEKSGQPAAVKFENLAPVADGIIAFLDEAVAARDPTLALAPGERPAGGADGEAREAGASGSTGAIRSLADANAALAAAAGYFARSEPSSPVLLLIGQAEALIGRSFYDAMTALMPDLSAQAAVKVGRDFSFYLPLERLSSLSVTAADGADDQVEDAAEDAAPQDDVSWSETASEHDAAGESDGESAEAEATDESDAVNESDGAPADGDAAADDPPADAEPANDDEHAAETAAEAAADSAGDGGPQPVRAPAHAPTVFRAINRPDAVTLLSQVATYFRAVEPSSPVPTLLDHAGGLAGRDFFTLLREMLPASALRVDE